MFARSKVENRRPADRVWVDGICVVKAEAPQQKLRGVLQAIGGEPRFGKDMTLDIVGYGLCVSFRFLGPAVMI